ncbi:CAP domain-containing protein [Streptomyces sp. NPDC052687]|uniref:CAP domain-containing protein n=1 Tax=Streptomyces sp. NPDC052687 TaxID=3154759 RepID=UPI00343877B7
MGKHRKKRHNRRILIGVVAMGAVAVPSVAVACGDWQSSEENALRSAARTTAGEWNHAGDTWRKDSDRDGRWTGHQHDGEPTATPSQSPAPSASTTRPTAPKSTATAAPSAPKISAAPSASKTSAAPSTPKPTASATPSTAPTPQSTPTASGAVARVVELVNAERAKAGCSPVKSNAILTKAAQAHSEDMASHRTMSHTGSDGSSPGDRITRAGYNWSTYGENVAYGYSTPEQVMAGWMSSPGHKANILNCGFKEIGVGLAQPGNYWTQDFGTAR